MASPFERYQVLRDEIHKEHQLISNRTTWFATSQSFLVTAFVLNKENEVFYTKMLPSVGLLISVVTFVAIIAALLAMSDLNVAIADLMLENKDLQGFPLCGKKPWIHFLGMTPPVVVPGTFFVIWLIMLVK